MNDLFKIGVTYHKGVIVSLIALFGCKPVEVVVTCDQEMIDAYVENCMIPHLDAPEREREYYQNVCTRIAKRIYCATD